MRVIDPKQFSQKPLKKKQNKRYFVFMILTLIAVFIFINQKSFQVDSPPLTELQVIQDDESMTDELLNEFDQEIPKNTIRLFTDNEFKTYYDNLLLPDLLRVENSPIITGDDIADARIRKIAEDRGYRLRSSPSVETVSLQGFPVQPRLVESWNSLQEVAAENGFSLQLTSGYRSVSSQRTLFLQSLQNAGIGIGAIADGLVDDKVTMLLKTAAPPGYSKHHTGYTIDVSCDGVVLQALRKTRCYEWFSANNFFMLKENGWMPSYPETAELQGPDPEPWELVWAGRERLLE